MIRIITTKSNTWLILAVLSLLFSFSTASAQGENQEQQQQQQGIERMEQTFSLPGRESIPRFAVKTNLLYGATTTFNLGVEMQLNRFLTLDVIGGFNPFMHANYQRFKHWSAQSTLRYWIQEPFNGHFIGVSALYSNFNVGGWKLPLGLLPNLQNYRFQGDALALSFQYGHQWLLSPRWAIETSINVGLMHLNYQKFEGGWCGEFVGNGTKNHLGITNAAISIIYIIR